MHANSLGDVVLNPIVASLIVAALLGAWALFWGPLKNRLNPLILRKTADHGIKLLVYGTPDEMGGLRPDEMLHVDPSWLADTDYYFPNGIPGPGPGDKREWADWARGHGAEGVGWRHVLIRIQSTQDRTVLVMKPQVNVRPSTVTGGAVLCPAKEPAGNGLMCRQFDIDLDDRPPGVNYYPEGGPEPAQFTMHKGDTEAFVVVTHATNGRYEWTFDIPVLVDGELFNLRADNHGQPFVLVGREHIDSTWWDFEKKEWRAPDW